MYLLEEKSWTWLSIQTIVKMSNSIILKCDCYFSIIVNWVFWGFELLTRQNKPFELDLKMIIFHIFWIIYGATGSAINQENDWHIKLKG